MIVVFVQSDGSFYYPTCDSSTGVPQGITGSINIPLGGLGSTTSVTLPDYISSARIWLADGTLLFYTVCDSDGAPSLVEPSSANPNDPNADTNWGFVEFTNNEDELDANISYVDLVGLPLGMTITHSDGSQQTVAGVQADAVNTICNALVSQAASDGQPWGDLCQVDSNGDYIRVIAPIDYISENPDAFEDYWTDYVNEVWSYYTDNTLTINAQDNINSAGNDNNITCTVSGSTMTCNEDDGTSYSQPAAVDIFGCNSGPFANTGDETNLIIIARLCAAFDRTTLLLSGGDVQPALPSSDYYTTGPTNYYSKFVHEQEADGMGYAFSYDDVNPTGENQSGTLTSGSPQALEIIVGGPIS